MNKTKVDNTFVLGVDLDQTGFSYEDGLKKEIILKNPHLGLELTDFPEMINYNFLHCGWPGLDSLEEYHNIHINAVNNGLFKKLKTYDHFPDTIKMLRENEVYVRIITHGLFPNSSYSKSVTHTIESLEKNNVEYDEICFSSRKHELLCDALIEDSPENIKLWQEHRNDGIFIFDQPYNRECSGRRVYDWIELGEKILEYKKEIGK